MGFVLVGDLDYELSQYAKSGGVEVPRHALRAGSRSDPVGCEGRNFRRVVADSLTNSNSRPIAYHEQECW